MLALDGYRDKTRSTLGVFLVLLGTLSGYSEKIGIAFEITNGLRQACLSLVMTAKMLALGAKITPPR
jgi:hypothetical protein